MAWVPEYIREELTDLEQMNGALNLLLQTAQTNNVLLARIYKLPGVPISMHITFTGTGLDQPATESDTETITGTATEIDALDRPAIVDTTKIVWGVSDPSLVNLIPNLDGTAEFQGLVPGTVHVVVRDTLVGLTAVNTLKVTLSSTNKIVIQWGQPVLDPEHRMKIKWGVPK